MNDSGSDVLLRWGVEIPLRDGIHLNALLYLPDRQASRAPAIFTLTPYTAQGYHDQGLYFASHGYVFLSVDVRGRGGSGGVFEPNLHEGLDGYDVVEWIASQPYCNGQVAMWGASYGGHAQWNTIREFPPHLETIVPVASPYIGVDFPMRNNVFNTYIVRWLAMVTGVASQERIFNDRLFWNRQFRHWLEHGVPFNDLDSQVGNPSRSFQDWVKHPRIGSFWRRYNPTAQQYAKVDKPVLTITGIYDGDQPGALMHFREHRKHASPEAARKHFLIIGPWDHAGTRIPKLEFCGLKVGALSLLDIQKLHREWYDWTLRGAGKPEFLQKNVAYYVMELDEWRYADTLEEITVGSISLHLDSRSNAQSVFDSGSLSASPPENEGEDHYVYDPAHVSLAALESAVDSEDRADQRMVLASDGKQLVYHSDPFEHDTEVSGFFEFSAWIAIDQPDTDFCVKVYEIDCAGQSVLLSSDWLRARHRESSEEESLVNTTDALHYRFNNFTFVSRLIKRACRLRLTVGPINSIFSQKNYNSGKPVSEESMQDARVANVRLSHGPNRLSTLTVPMGKGPV
jgi:uncharacterized protein